MRCGRLKGCVEARTTVDLFIGADPQLLDHKGTEFVLIGADEELPGELGITLKPEDERLDPADIFEDLEFDCARFPTKPLTKGEWR